MHQAFNLCLCLLQLEETENLNNNSSVSGGDRDSVEQADAAELEELADTMPALQRTKSSMSQNLQRVLDGRSPPILSHPYPFFTYPSYCTTVCLIVSSTYQWNASTDVRCSDKGGKACNVQQCMSKLPTKQNIHSSDWLK